MLNWSFYVASVFRVFVKTVKCALRNHEPIQGRHDRNKGTLYYDMVTKHSVSASESAWLLPRDVTQCVTRLDRIRYICHCVKKHGCRVVDCSVLIQLSHHITSVA
jgi:hypothetical protein